jgi:hypothetical protein
MGNYRYKINALTGLFDMVNKTSGSSTSEYTMYSALTAGVNTITHGRNARTTSVDVWSLDATNLIALVNDIRTKYTVHIASVNLHAHTDATNVITAPAATDLLTAYNLAVDIMNQYIAHNADAELAGGWAYHSGKNSPTHVLSFAGITFTSTTLIAALNEIKLKFNAHDGDTASHGPGVLHPVIVDDVFAVWAYSVYAPREDSSDILNNIIIDSSVSDLIKLTLYF